MNEFLKKYSIASMTSLHENDIRMLVELAMEPSMDTLQEHAKERPCHVSTTILKNPTMAPINILKELEPWLSLIGD